MSRVVWPGSRLEKSKHMMNIVENKNYLFGLREMAKNYTVGPRLLPGMIIERNGPLSYLIKVSGGKLWRGHIDQLREIDDTLAEHSSEQLQESLEDEQQNQPKLQ